MKKIISLLIAVVLVSSLALTAFATTYDMSKFEVTSAPKIDDTVAAVNEALKLEGWDTANARQLNATISASSTTDSIKWVKKGTTDELKADDKFEAGEYTLTVVYASADFNVSESTQYMLNGNKAAEGSGYKDNVLTITGVINISAPKYTLTYDTTCNGTSLKAIPSATYESDATIVYPGDKDVAVEGYDFGGWFEDKELTKKAPEKMPEKDITVYAKYTKKEVTYTLSYDAKGIKEFESKKLAKDAKLILPNTDVEGYRFDGWYSDSEFKTPIPAKMPANDITLYASYVKVYKLSFDTNSIQKIDDQWYEADEEIKLPDAEAKGYTFIGWFADKEYKTPCTLAKMPKADTTIYGLFAVNLSTLSDEFKEVDVAKAVADLGLTPDTFNKLAKGLGFEIKYTINGKEYKINDIVNYVQEMTKQIETDVKAGQTADVTVTIKLGKDDEGQSFKFTVYNDTNKANDKKEEPTSEPTSKPTTEPTTKDNGNSLSPNTGSASIIPAIITLLASTAAAGVVIAKKKKEN